MFACGALHEIDLLETTLAETKQQRRSGADNTRYQGSMRPYADGSYGGHRPPAMQLKTDVENSDEASCWWRNPAHQERMRTSDATVVRVFLYMLANQV